MEFDFLSQRTEEQLQSEPLMDGSFRAASRLALSVLNFLFILELSSSSQREGSFLTSGSRNHISPGSQSLSYRDSLIQASPTHLPASDCMPGWAIRDFIFVTQDLGP